MEPTFETLATDVSNFLFIFLNEIDHNLCTCNLGCCISESIHE